MDIFRMRAQPEPLDFDGSLNDVLIHFSIYKLIGTEHNDRLFLHAFSYDDTNIYTSRRFFRTRDICTPFLHS
jgi:hypothetical protein